MPVRRGALGFLAAAIVGVFCGGVAGITVSALEWHPALQYVITAGTGVLGDRVLSGIMSIRISQSKVTNVSITGGNNQNAFGDHADLDQEQKG